MFWNYISERIKPLAERLTDASGLRVGKALDNRIGLYKLLSKVFLWAYNALLRLSGYPLVF